MSESEEKCSAPSESSQHSVAKTSSSEAPQFKRASCREASRSFPPRRADGDFRDPRPLRKKLRLSPTENSRLYRRSMTRSTIDSDTYRTFDAWELRRAAAGETPLLFRGNRSRERRSPSVAPRDITDSVLAPPRCRMMEEAEAGVDEETVQNVDRQWYDTEESSYFQHEGKYEEDASLAKHEEHLKYRQAQLESAKQRANLRESVRNADQQLWELNRLRHSGVTSQEHPSLLQTLFELPSADATNDSAVHVLVRELKPPFLDGRIRYTTQVDPVPVVRDPTSDLVVLAKRGSAAVRQLRQQEDRTKMQRRFWEVGGSAMGAAIGVGASQKTKEELEDDEDGRDYRKNAQFAKFLTDTGGATEFSQNLTLAEQRQRLPIFEVRDRLLSCLRDHQIVVLVGQTGSGKTTQLTQYLCEEGYARTGRIGCTQPRRVAAVSVAKRVADEMGVPLGEQVGYAIRFEDCTSAATVIQYMTDGILLRESLTDPDLDRYAVVVMDEAHERSLNTDILFGVMRGVCARRRDFRLIVTSATMNAQRFSEFFGHCPTFDIPGRTFPVAVEYVRSPVDDYVDAAVQRALQVHCSGEAGDILVFMTGREDIEATCCLLGERVAQLGEKVAPLSVLPIYSALPADLQARIFQRSEHRKVIVASNIAETSLTVDGIRFVIDTGYAKLKVFNPKIGMDSLQITPISQANAQQRSGRAGRTSPGVCYRLYTERAFVSEMFENHIPEIQRTNLSHTVLLLKSLGISNLLEFDFMDPPPQETILSSMYQLWVLGALDNLGNLTVSGSQMVEFPLDPPLSKMLLSAASLGCTAEVLIIVSMLSVPSVFFRPKERAEESDAAREKFFAPESDHLTLLNTYLQWRRNGSSASWASEHFVHQKAMKKIGEVQAQLLDILNQQRIAHVSSGVEWSVVQKAICSGYFHNAAKLRGIGEYVNLITSIPCHLHPSSALFGSGTMPEYTVYHEVVLTTKEYMQTVTAVEPQWLAELGPMFFYLKESTSSLSEKRQQDRTTLAQQEQEFQAKIAADAVRQQEERQERQKIFRVATPGIKTHQRAKRETQTVLSRPDTPMRAEKRLPRIAPPRILQHMDP